MDEQETSSMEYNARDLIAMGQEELTKLLAQHKGPDGNFLLPPLAPLPKPLTEDERAIFKSRLL
jgi:hypothetical protein